MALSNVPAGDAQAGDTDHITDHNLLRAGLIEVDAEKIDKSIITAKGDIISGSSSGIPMKTAVGSNGQLLTADSTAAGGVSWITPSTGVESQGCINVRARGVVSSSSIDQTAIIADLDAEAYQTNRVLYFPGGVYKFATELYARSIVGDGRNSTILRYTGTGVAIGSVGNGSTRGYGKSVSRLVLQGLGYNDPQLSDGVGLDLNAESSGYYENLSIVGFDYGVNIRTSTGSAYSLYNVFNDVTVQRSQEGFRLENVSNENRFYSCRVQNFYNNAGTGNYGFRIISGNHNIIRDCALEGIGDTSSDWAIYISGGGADTANNIITGTRFETNQGNIYITSGVVATQFTQNYVHSSLAHTGPIEWISDSGTNSNIQWNYYL